MDDNVRLDYDERHPDRIETNTPNPNAEENKTTTRPRRRDQTEARKRSWIRMTTVFMRNGYASWYPRPCARERDTGKKSIGPRKNRLRTELSGSFSSREFFIATRDRRRVVRTRRTDLFAYECCRMNSVLSKRRVRRDGEERPRGKRSIKINNI